MWTKLHPIVKTTIKPYPPFNFKYTVYKPSHFPTPVFEYRNSEFVQTMNFEGNVYGIKLKNLGSVNQPKISITIFSSGKIKADLKDRIIDELSWRYGFNEDLSEFFSSFKEKPGPLNGPLKRLWGMRMSCKYSLYGLAVVAIVLQNATVRRSTQMLRSLLEKYGGKFEISGKRIYSFWEPEAIANTSIHELRSSKVGYRAKILKHVSKQFANNEVNVEMLKKADKESAKRELLKLKGVGKVSAQILLIEYLRK